MEIFSVKTVGRVDRIYVGCNDFDAAPSTATIDLSTDGGITWTSVRIDSIPPFNQDGRSIRPSVAHDGVVYAAFFHRTNSVGQIRIADVVVVRDDGGAVGPNPFQDLQDSTLGVSGQRVVTGRSIPWINGFGLGQERIGSTLSLAVDPNDSTRLYVAWADRVGTNDYTVHVRGSTDSGQTWSTADLRTITDATNMSLAIADNGTVGLLYQQLTTPPGTTTPRWVTHLEQTQDDFVTINDTVLATTPANTPVVVFWPYLGDYTGLLAQGSSFRGVFSANNTPNLANFPQGVLYQRSADFTTQTLDNGKGTPVAISIDPFYFSVQVIQ